MGERRSVFERGRLQQRDGETVQSSSAVTIERVRAIETKLTDAFAPVTLQVKDQSHLHAGHEGAKGGGGHFQVTIVSTAFEGLQSLQRHRMVFSALGSMMDTDIHALRITASTPAEIESR